jgi:LuxR family maltose regulon positive regulatory protein
LYKLGKIDAAYKCMSRALELGEPEGYVRTFVDLGSPMQDLLGIAARRRSDPNYINKLLAAFPTATVQPAPLEIRELIEPLNDRETQILRLLSARYTYREISEELYLSLNTVKWYTKNIYSKLGVSKKHEAAARARELGLV